jgi:hypothetical protein
MEILIAFDRRDHPGKITHSGTYPLVVKTTIGTKCLSRVLMDGGSTLNIMYAEAFDAPGIARSVLHPSIAPIRSIMPGFGASPLEQVALPVTFGDPSNFRTKRLEFKVVDFRGHITPF